LSQAALVLVHLLGRAMPAAAKRAEVLLELGQVLPPRPPTLAVPSPDKLVRSRPWCAWLGRQLLRSAY